MYQRKLIKRNVIIIASNWLLMGLAETGVGTYFYLYAVSLGASSAQVGLIAAANAVTSFFIKPFGGYLADRYGRKAIIVPATFSMALVSLFFSLSTFKPYKRLC